MVTLRRFNMNNDALMGFSHRVQQHFINNIDAFHRHNGKIFNPKFNANWLLSVNMSKVMLTKAAAQPLPVDDNVRQYINVMVRARDKATEVKYYVMQIFKGKSRITDGFDFDYYDRAEASPSGMMVFLTSLYQLCSGKLYDKLVAKGYSPQKIKEINTVIDALEAYVLNPPAPVMNMMQTENQLTKQLNETFAYWEVVNIAAKTIFAKKPHLLNLFLFPYCTEELELINIAGKVFLPDNIMPNQVSVNIENLGIKVSIDCCGMYAIGGLNNGHHVLTAMINNRINAVKHVELVSGMRVNADIEIQPAA